MLLTTLAFAQGIANVMNNLNYQIVGIMVVMMCLGGLAVILTISGSIAAAIQNRAKAKTAAPVAAPAAAPAAAGKPGMTPEMLAILSAAVDSAMTELTPEMVAFISAAVERIFSIVSFGTLRRPRISCFISPHPLSSVFFHRLSA